jgi:hypothetical protein
MIFCHVVVHFTVCLSQTLRTYSGGISDLPRLPFADRETNHNNDISDVACLMALYLKPISEVDVVVALVRETSRLMWDSGRIACSPVRSRDREILITRATVTLTYIFAPHVTILTAAVQYVIGTPQRLNSRAHDIRFPGGFKTLPQG